MNGFEKVLRDLQRHIESQEKDVERRLQEIETLRSQYGAMAKLFEDSSFSNLPVEIRLRGDSTNHSKANKNLFPVIVDFVKKHPGSTVAEIRKAVKGGDALVRYHLKRQAKMFKTSSREGVRTYSVAK